MKLWIPHSETTFASDARRAVPAANCQCFRLENLTVFRKSLPWAWYSNMGKMNRSFAIFPCQINNKESKKDQQAMGCYKWHMIQHMMQMSVSENSGTPKSSILIGFSIINHPFWGTPIFGNPQMTISEAEHTAAKLPSWGHSSEPKVSSWQTRHSKETALCFLHP